MSQIQPAPLINWYKNQPKYSSVLKMMKAITVLLCALVLPLMLMCLWWLAFDKQWLPEQILPAPEWVWLTTLDLWNSGELKFHFMVSAQRIFYSVLLGGGVGLGLGIWFALSRSAQRYVLPSMYLITQFPIIAWIPLLMIFLGIDEVLKIVAISFAVMTPVLISTIKGIQNVSHQVLDVAEVYRFSKFQTFFKVIFPASLPSIVSGLRQGIMQAWLALVFVELLASSEGIGYLMVWGRQLMQMDIVFMSIIFIGVTGFFLDSVLGLLEKQARFYVTKVKG